MKTYSTENTIVGPIALADRLLHSRIIICACGLMNITNHAKLCERRTSVRETILLRLN
jgi:hypothetical protein